MNKLKQRLSSSELFVKILLVVIFCIVITSFFTLSIVINRSKKTYIDTYQASTLILLDKIQKDYDSLNDNVNRIFDLADNSQVVEDYLTAQNDHSGTIIEFIKQMESTRSIFEGTPSNLMLIGKNGKTFVQNGGIKKQSADNFLTSELVNKLNESQSISQYVYQNSGPTTATEDQSGILYVRKLTHNKSVFGYAMIFIAEKDFGAIYEDLLSDTFHTVFIVNPDNQVISSTNKKVLGQTLPKKFFQETNESVTKVPLYSYHFTLYNTVDLNTLIANMNLIKPTILIAVFAIILVSIFAFFIIRKATAPIYQLIEHIPAVKQGDFSQKVDVAGTYETRQLGLAYNMMLEDLDSYFRHILETEADKRLIELHSLQLQIQPHFIYNTLTAIKFLIWQNENDRALEALDNFIHLLRYTLSNKDEFVPLNQELHEMTAYISILKLRYGNRIQFSQFIDESCQEALIPKMILQPIIENAYLHAFPNEQPGLIQLFARQVNSQLIIEIIDNGIGFQTTETDSLNSDTLKTAQLHYSGVGLNNIQERITLIYGQNATIRIESVSEKGTQITLNIPLMIP
ncbi:two-component sensor histidine kinase [Vagococcus penaei]|uniref:Two-component sensor histidine kinase n=1 Tax=Vagococcus penaei TaxID=633807 RepID=A0A1Q2D5K1_9ENTE|nr:histidine kinase [Vagococcus penaei]AQP53649.1 two-component sensor histidine kinase [Vagococcus penaei]RST98085.1 two-component sensor histidine kinase [Vagococcus penaei]